MAKKNIRSIRFDDDIMKIILDFEGNNFNDKFENLVNFCYGALPAKRKQYKKLCDECDELRDVIKDLNQERLQLINEIVKYRDIKNSLTQIQLTACDILEELEKCNTKQAAAAADQN